MNVSKTALICHSILLATHCLYRSQSRWSTLQKGPLLMAGSHRWWKMYLARTWRKCQRRMWGIWGELDSSICLRSQRSTPPETAQQIIILDLSDRASIWPLGSAMSQSEDRRQRYKTPFAPRSSSARGRQTSTWASLRNLTLIKATTRAHLSKTMLKTP